MTTLQLNLTPGNKYILTIPYTKAKIQINIPLNAEPFALITQGKGTPIQVHNFKFDPRFYVVEETDEEISA